ncbi:MAG TPA: hypothetical protein VFU21_01500, partial [Kofleriaceae bacterium]|nr:hypothetical protein [Kofleriaceae bacterium]
CELTIEPGNCDASLEPGEPVREQADDLRRQMRVREVLSWSLYGLGAAAIGAGLYLYFTQPQDDASSSVAISASPTSDGGMVFFSLTH